MVCVFQIARNPPHATVCPTPAGAGCWRSVRNRCGSGRYRSALGATAGRSAEVVAAGGAKTDPVTPDEYSLSAPPCERQDGRAEHHDPERHDEVHLAYNPRADRRRADRFSVAGELAAET